MTVVEVYGAMFRYRYRCVWPGKNGEREHELFQASQLVHVESSQT
jgi:hypothetical protein